MSLRFYPTDEGDVAEDPVISAADYAAGVRRRFVVRSDRGEHRVVMLREAPDGLSVGYPDYRCDCPLATNCHDIHAVLAYVGGADPDEKSAA